jgi:AcrR family transcriptional regulator
VARRRSESAPELGTIDSLGPLSGGRHNFDPAVLAHSQRERLIAAVAKLVAEHGYADTTIGQIADEASVSRRTLYEIFSGKEECFLAAFTALDDHVADLMEEARAGEDAWPDQVAAAFAAMIHFFAERPNFARAYLVEAAAVGESLATAREEATDRLTKLLSPGRDYISGPGPGPGMEEALIGGILVLLAGRVVAGEASRLSGYIPAVVEFALLPYVGVQEARAAGARVA